jgi:hypothetical protein
MLSTRPITVDYGVTFRKEAGLTLTAGCPAIEVHLALSSFKGRVKAWAGSCTNYKYGGEDDGYCR